MLGSIFDIGLFGQGDLTAGIPFYQQGWFQFIVVVAIIVGLIWLANRIAKSLRMPDYGSRIGIISISVALSVMVILSLWWEDPDRPGPKLGVDLRGGVYIVGQLNLDELNTDVNQFSADKTDAQSIIPTLLNRVDPSGTKDVLIRSLGQDKIEVIIPDVSLNEADGIWYSISKTGQLLFRIAADRKFHSDVMKLAENMAEPAEGRPDTSRNVYRNKGDERPVARWYNLARLEVRGSESEYTDQLHNTYFLGNVPESATPKDVQEAFSSIAKNSVRKLRVRDPKLMAAGVEKYAWFVDFQNVQDADRVLEKKVPEINGQKIEITRVRPVKYWPPNDENGVNPFYLRDKTSGRLLNLDQFPISRDAAGETLPRELWGKRFAELLLARNQIAQMLMIEPESERSDVRGQHLTAIRPSRDETGRPSVGFDLSAEGAKKMTYLTTMHKPDGDDFYKLGIVLDGEVHSAPDIQTTISTAGRITGQFTNKEIEELINNLRSGKLDVALDKSPISKQFIESSLGIQLRDKGIWAIGASFVIVLVFMIIYYRFAGIVAAIALLLNLVLILALIMFIRQPLTLNGLAGLVLTVGMSVDANVLIFERIREELAKGAALRMAIRNGFDKATVTIVDANVTTLITALVLYVIGTEQIKGFAVTLILGILMSMYTAIYCSRTVFDIAERKRWISNLNMTQIIGKHSFNFLNKRAITSFASIVLIIGGIGCIFSLGAKLLDHDLRGGSTATVVFNQEMKRNDIKDTLEGLGLQHEGEDLEFTVAVVGSPEDNTFKVDTNLPQKTDESTDDRKELSEILIEAFPEKLKLHNVQIEAAKDLSSTQTGFKLPPYLNQQLLGAAFNFRYAPVLMLQDEGGEQESATPETNQDGDGEPTTQEGGDAQATPDGEGEQTPVIEEEQQVVSFNMVFENNITGRAIKTILAQASDELTQDPLEESQIRVIPEVASQDSSAIATNTTRWTVEIQASNADTVKSFLDKWQTQFNAKPYFPVTGGVGGQIARSTQLQALAAIVASLLGIIAYVWIRFQNVAFGLAAVVALIHDVLIVLGAFALSHYVASALGFMLIEDFKISLPVVAALLTIIGYSLNDTIVVFDRIREVRGKRTEMTEDMINSSISQTLSRTILTSLTTFIVVFILYVFGGDAIHGFAFALVIGVVVGTYSSIFIASPTLLWLMNRGFSPEYDEEGNPIKPAKA